MCGRASRYYVQLASRYGQLCTSFFFLNVHIVVWSACSFNSLSVFPGRKLSPPPLSGVGFSQSARASVFSTDSGDQKRINEFGKFPCRSRSLSGKVLGRVTIACCTPNLSPHPTSEFFPLSHSSVPPNQNRQPPPSKL